MNANRQADMPTVHSPAWVAQTWVSFVMSTSFMMVGIYAMQADLWIKGFLVMGVWFVIGSTLSLAKTTRDVHESGRIVARIDEARVTRLIAEHDPLKG